MIVITTPTSQIGRQVLLNISESAESIRVIARDPSRLPEPIRTRVEVVQGSHGDPEVVDQAFSGADCVFWLVPPDPRARTVESAYVDFTRPACDAFKRRGVKRAVGVSAISRGTPWATRAGLVTASLAMDDLIASTGVSFRALTMPSFMENILRQTQSIRTAGVFSLPLSGDRKLPTCATRDIAAVAAKLLLDRSWSGQDTVPVLGPEDLSFNEMAQIMSEALGKSVRFQQISFEAHKARLTEHGMSEAMAQGMVNMMTAKNEGLDLVVCLYVHVAGSVDDMVRRMASGVAPGGTLFMVGHRPIDPATGKPTAAASQVQVSVESAVAGLDPSG